MALTLPYPDMVFVPLDILTAEEQNQLVGNIEFLANQFPLSASNIANGAIGSDQLAAGAVKSNNVDWGSMPQDADDRSSSYFQVGGLLLSWGAITANNQNTGAYAETTYSVTFPKAYSVAPRVVASTTDVGGYIGEYLVVSNASTTSVNITIGHVKEGGGTSSILQWIAIGIGASS